MTKILIVDDDAVVIKLMSRVLGRQGFSIVSASSGLSAMQQIHDPSLNLIVADIFIPELLDGLEFICKTKLKRPDVKLIAMSDGTDYLKPDLSISMAMNLGAVACLNKPIDTILLLKTIKNQMDCKRSRGRLLSQSNPRKIGLKI